MINEAHLDDTHTQNDERSCLYLEPCKMGWEAGCFYRIKNKEPESWCRAQDWLGDGARLIGHDVEHFQRCGGSCLMWCWGRAAASGLDSYANMWGGESHTDLCLLVLWASGAMLVTKKHGERHSCQRRDDRRDGDSEAVVVWSQRLSGEYRTPSCPSGVPASQPSSQRWIACRG